MHAGTVEPMTAEPTTAGRRVPNEGGERLATLRTRTRLTGAQAAARSVTIRRLRFILPVLALLLIAAFFFTAGEESSDDVFLNDFADLEAVPTDLRMANPEFTGVDDEGNPFNITATSAVRRPEEKQSVDLVDPRAVTRRGDRPIIIFADRGAFAEDTKMLSLSSGVTLEQEIGGRNYVLRTPAATVAMETETVQSEAGVEGEGPGGARLKADRLDADSGAGRVRFEGNVSMRLYPNNANADPDVESTTQPEPQR